MIDFTGVKAITIPEGSVKKISANGVVLWEKITSRVPSEYQEVEYIFIPGTAYINTQWTPSDGTLFNFVFSSTSTQYTYPFGTGSSPRLALAYTPGQNATIFNSTNATVGMYTFAATANKIHEIETYTTNVVDGSYVVIDGEKKANGGRIDANLIQSLPMLLGAWQYNATTIRQGEIKLYYAKANVAGVDVFEMIPCYRKADGVIGMYDLVSKTLFTNAGTGSFTKGADV